MADWSQLPEELLQQTSTLLPSCIDLLRFRSICSSWRSSATYPPHSLPHNTPIRPSNPQTNNHFDTTTHHFHLSKRIILHLTSSHHPHHAWIIKLQQDDPPTSHLLNPLSESKIQPLPFKSLNLINLRVIELGQEYVLHCAGTRPFYLAGDLYREKVVFSTKPSWSEETDCVIMTVHVSGKLALFKLKESVWCIIDEMQNPYDDVIYYKGEFYAVDGTGRAVVVVGQHCLGVKEVAGAVFGGDKKYLVEFEGELLLIDRYLSVGSEDHPIYNNEVRNYEIYVPNDDAYVIDTTVQFKVFKLDWCEENWVEVKSLGERILFLGENCSFSALASDFCGSKGNCIYFTDRYFQSNREEDGSFKNHCIGVFNLEDGSIGPLARYPGYSQLFWPPPTWVTSGNS